MRFPWTIHEAEVALYPARKDGWPLTGPSAARGPVPIFRNRASLRVEASYANGAAASFDYTGNVPPLANGYSIQVDLPEGPREDKLTLALSSLEPEGLYCLAVRFIDSGDSGLWTLWRFFYVTLESDGTGEQSEVMQRSIRLRSTYRQETVGATGEPELRPEPMGEVEWVCGPLRVPAMNYDPATGAWTSTALNRVSADPDDAPFVAIGETDGTAWLSYFLPRAENPDGPTLAGDPTLAGTPLTVAWCHNFAFSVNPAGEVMPLLDFVLQTNGTPEPLLHLPQSRVWDEPMVVFRYLNRIYMTVGHRTIAIPSLSAELPPPTHEPDFRIGKLRLLPFGGFRPPAS